MLRLEFINQSLEFINESSDQFLKFSQKKP